jgi:ubiquinone/menaquinone biosynthesis C-methylase UbiE
MIKECIDTFGNDRQFRFSIGKIEELPFFESCFDVVLCLGAFEYVMDRHPAVSEIVRVLKPKGIVIITMLNGMSPYRIWQQLLYWKIINIKNRLIIKTTDGNNSQGEKRSKVTLYKEKDFRNLLVSHGLEVEDALYYDHNLFFSPLDALFPRTSVLLSRKLEFLCRSKLKYLGTGFILKCRKK